MDCSNRKYMNYYTNTQVFRMKLSDLMGLRPQYGVNGGLVLAGTKDGRADAYHRRAILQSDGVVVRHADRERVETLSKRGL